MRTAGVIVTYNRKELLYQNIISLMEQTVPLDVIIIIDNCSTDGTKEFLQEKGFLDRKDIIYKALSQNLGGAGGFYYGTKEAYDLGYDFAWLMDDDGRPYCLNTFERVIITAKELYVNNPLLLLNSLVVCDNNTLAFGLGGYNSVEKFITNVAGNIYINKINPFNGTLVSKELMQSIGFPNKDFFIKGDEVDYTIRAKKVGAYVATVIDSLYYHPIIEVRYRKILWKNFKIMYEPPWKQYYRARNHSYIYISNKKYIRLVKDIAWMSKNIILSNKNVISGIRMMIFGVFDGVKGKLGATVKP